MCKLGFIGEIVDATLASLREGGGCRRHSEGEAKLQENARNITSALDKNTRSPSPPTAELPPGVSPLNKLNSPINQNLEYN